MYLWQAQTKKIANKFVKIWENLWNVKIMGFPGIILKKS